MRRDKSENIHKQCENVGRFSRTSCREMYKAVKQITKRSTVKTDNVRDACGETLTERDKIKERWKSYCENLYKKQESLLRNTE